MLAILRLLIREMTLQVGIDKCSGMQARPGRLPGSSPP